MGIWRIRADVHVRPMTRPCRTVKGSMTTSDGRIGTGPHAVTFGSATTSPVGQATPGDGTCQSGSRRWGGIKVEKEIGEAE